MAAACQVKCRSSALSMTGDSTLKSQWVLVPFPLMFALHLSRVSLCRGQEAESLLHPKLRPQNVTWCPHPLLSWAGSHSESNPGSAASGSKKIIFLNLFSFYHITSHRFPAAHYKTLESSSQLWPLICLGIWDSLPQCKELLLPRAFAGSSSTSV